MGQLISKFLSHVLPGVVRPLHALWNEVIGFLFIVFAVVAAFYVIRAVHAPSKAIIEEWFISFSRPYSEWSWVIFGVSSFLRARKISRS